MRGPLGLLLFSLLLAGCAETPQEDPATSPYAAAPLAHFEGLGGRFTLTDQRGRPFELGGGAGRGQLLFFGYTYCPDACPLTLARLSEAYRLLGGGADSLLTVFVSLDPKRDTPEALAQYLEHFPLEVVGLTAPPQRLDQVVAAFGAHYRLAPSPARAGYFVDHSTYLYLIDRDGRVRFLFDQEDSPTKIAAVARQLFAEWQRPAAPLVAAAYDLGKKAPLGCGVLRRGEHAPPVWFFAPEADSAKGGDGLGPKYPLGLEAFDGLPTPR